MRSLIVVPRERASVAVASLESIYKNTEPPFELVYVDCLLYGSYRAEVQRLVEKHGHNYIRNEQQLYPNQARNIGAAAANGEYLVFVDNDIFLEEGWLTALVACAEETGAGVVGPLYLEGDRENPDVHCAGGSIDFKTDADGVRHIIVRQNDLRTPLAKIPKLERGPTGLVEFHAVLVSRKCYDAMNCSFDEDLLTTREHVDLCLSARQAGFEVYFQPESKVRYGFNEPITTQDLEYFLFRWSKKATKDTIAHFERKWDVKLDSKRERIIRKRRQKAISSATG